MCGETYTLQARITHTTPFRIQFTLGWITFLYSADELERLKEDIRDYLDLNDSGEVSPAILWDMLKAVMRGKIISITSTASSFLLVNLLDCPLYMYICTQWLKRKNGKESYV